MKGELTECVFRKIDAEAAGGGTAGGGLDWDLGSLCCKPPASADIDLDCAAQALQDILGPPATVVADPALEALLICEGGRGSELSEHLVAVFRCPDRHERQHSTWPASLHPEQAALRVAARAEADCRAAVSSLRECIQAEHAALAKSGVAGRRRRSASFSLRDTRYYACGSGAVLAVSVTDKSGRSPRPSV